MSARQLTPSISPRRTVKHGRFQEFRTTLHKSALPRLRASIEDGTAMRGLGNRFSRCISTRMPVFCDFLSHR